MQRYEFINEFLKHDAELKKPESSILDFCEIQEWAELIFGYRNQNSG